TVVLIFELYFLFYFFFQAEDGIRYSSVTGVQTCALPICPRCGEKIQRIRYADNETNYCVRCQTGGKVLADRSLSRLLRSDWPRRSEERRVGKGGKTGVWAMASTTRNEAEVHGRTSVV